MNSTENPDHEKAKIALEGMGYRDIIVIYTQKDGCYLIAKFSRYHGKYGRQTEIKRIRITPQS